MSRWLVNHATPTPMGPQGWDLAGFAQHAQVALSMPRREGVVALRARLRADRPLSAWTATEAPVLFWRAPGGLARVGLGQLARCPVHRLRLVEAPTPQDWRVHPDDWAQVVNWQQQHVTSSWFAVQVGWPQTDAEGTWLPLDLWLPVVWLAELPNGQGLDVWWHAERSDPAAALGQLGALLVPPAPVTSVPDGIKTWVGSSDVEQAIWQLNHNALLKKVVLGWPELWQTTQSPAEWLAQVLAVRPQDYAIAVRPLPDSSLVVCASPERLVAVDATQIRSMALAGTLQPGQELDDRLQTEHGLVRDFVLHTLAGLGVQQPECTPFLRAAGPLQHMATSIQAPRPAGLSALQVALALHPTPALLGWPRMRALEVVAQCSDPLARGWYGGFAGVLAADGSGQGELAVLLRGAEATPDASGWLATAWAGAGLVATSQPADERAEIANKHRAIAQSMGWLRGA